MAGRPGVGGHVSVEAQDGRGEWEDGTSEVGIGGREVSPLLARDAGITSEVISRVVEEFYWRAFRDDVLGGVFLRSGMSMGTFEARAKWCWDGLLLAGGMLRMRDGQVELGRRFVLADESCIRSEGKVRVWMMVFARSVRGHTTPQMEGWFMECAGGIARRMLGGQEHGG